MSALLTRQTKVEIDESNIAVLGRPELQAKHQAQGVGRDPSWDSVREKGGVKIWRIEQSQLIDWPDRGPQVYRAYDRYGYFYDEDAYIVSHTYKADPNKTPLSYDVFYWIGRKATQDDTATAAYRSVELDEYLGKQAVHYREAQGHESDRFLALFPTFMVYRGGRSTQWHHPSIPLNPGVKKIYRMWTTTYKVHEEFVCLDPKRKQVISYELSFDDLEIEQGGIYVYDSCDRLALFSTRASLAWERFWVGEMAMHIGYSRTGFFNNFAQFDEGTPGDTEFMKLVGADRVVPLHSRVYDDTVGPPARLHRLGETAPSLKHALVASPVTLGELDSNAIYVLDDYGNAHYPVVYVWVGKGVADTKARFALANGEVYLEEKKVREGPQVSLSVAVVRMREGLETPQFRKAVGLASAWDAGRSDKR